MDDLKWIKKHYSESLSHLCRREFPTLLETEGLLSEVLEKKFAHSKCLGDDLQDEDNLSAFKDIIYYEISDKEEKQDKDDNFEKTPEELLKLVGYTLYPECLTEEDIQSFRHYYYRPDGKTPTYFKGKTPEYRKGEELCTFNGDRLNSCRVWFAVKDNVDDIKRENFKKPERQDEYGTSVISIQFPKSKLLSFSIKNRYNHTVKRPDATFSNNLENIVPGLTSAFEKQFGVTIENGGQNAIKDYILGSDGKYHRENVEIDGIHYCENNIIIDQEGNITQLPPHIILVDNCVIDTKTNKIHSYDGNTSSTPNYTEGIISINVEKGKNGERIITVRFKDKEDIQISYGKHNEMLSISDPNLQHMKDGYCCLNRYIKSINFPNLQDIGNDCFNNANRLTSLNLPNLQRIENVCFENMDSLKSIFLPNLHTIGIYCFGNRNALTSLTLPNLQKMGYGCFGNTDFLTSLELPNLKSMGYGCFENAESLKVLELPSLQEMGKNCFKNANSLTSLKLSMLQNINSRCFENVDSLASLEAPALQKISFNNFLNATSLPFLYLPDLKQIKLRSFVNVPSLRELSLPNLQEMGQECFQNANSLTSLNVSSLQSMGFQCFQNASLLPSLSIPNLQEMGQECFQNVESLTLLYLPNLRSTICSSFEDANSLQEVTCPQQIESLDINPVTEQSDEVLHSDVESFFKYKEQNNEPVINAENDIPSSAVITLDLTQS